jgi:methylated-DNA-[protein]-cysteine S-methyltransferase
LGSARGKQFDARPKGKYNHGTPMSDVKFSIWHSPFGWIGMAANSRGLVAITVPHSSRHVAAADLVTIIGTGATRGENVHLRHARVELERYFRQDPDANLQSVSLDANRGTPFERQVWRRLRDIPYGETRTYGELARELGRPRAARAVGQCNAKNPWAILVPCHRVVGADARLTGYAGGLVMKRRLLGLEGINVTALRAMMLAAETERNRGHADRD